jgi:DNA processing protein
VIVVSGGAEGVDTNAHRGALAGGGVTWCVACTGRGDVFPLQNADLFHAVERSRGSRMIWPFPDGTPKDENTPRKRNGVLVGLAECVIVLQAKMQSGSRNAASWARRQGVPLFIAPGRPWDHEFEGSNLEIMEGAQPLLGAGWLFHSLQLPKPDLKDPRAILGKAPPYGSIRRRARRPETIGDLPLFPVDRSTWSEDEKAVFSRLSLAPRQQDAIIASAGLPTSSTLTALLTLSLKDVVVEGPDGFFRRRIAL